MCGFIIDIHDLWHFDLHAVSHFILIDAGKNLWISIGFEFFLIDCVDGIDQIFFQISGHPSRIFQKQNWITFGAALDSLIDRREEPTSPHALACIGSFAARSENHKPGEILVFCA